MTEVQPHDCPPDQYSNDSADNNIREEMRVARHARISHHRRDSISEGIDPQHIVMCGNDRSYGEGLRSVTGRKRLALPQEIELLLRL